MIKFYIQNNFAYDTVEIYAYEEGNGKHCGIELEQYKDGKLEVKRVDLKEYESNLKPVLRIARGFAKDLLPGLQAALDNAGIEKPSESKTAGRLEATERHLLDLQKIVFKMK